MQGYYELRKREETTSIISTFAIMGLDIIIPLLVLALCLLPNLAGIWLLRKLKVLERLGIISLVLCVLSVIAGIASYFLLRQNVLASLSLAIAGALMAFVSIDYCLSRQQFGVRVIGTLFYFALLVYCEVVIFGIVGHM